MRRLGLKVSRKYKRIFKVTRYPKIIQEELVKYPETLAEDSSYEDDDEVIRNHATNPVAYIEGKDGRKRDAIEMCGEPYRIRTARTKRGDKNYKSFAQYIIYKAVNVALERQGLPRHMTEERRWGKHIKNAEMLNPDTY